MKTQTFITLAFATSALANVIDRFNVNQDDIIIGNDFQGFEVLNLKENDEQILKKTTAEESSTTTHKKEAATSTVESSTTKTHKKEASSTSSSGKKHKSETHSITKTNDGMQLDGAGAFIAGPIAIIAGLLL
ncbi:beta-1,6-N-acetylglucosaminyltransferase, WSC domain-containing protein-containing protein [Scheffersomyces coipomensis]|uniref:beta-1,6-N-acetylglucosaminyltransferase, WSC domain-containing protein-containing protein n=1 Tax=Scheffersomyces coipomensis TaxID=1788519 RepID=UPI00315CEB8D